MDRHHHNEETAQRALDAGARRDAAYQGSVLLAEQRRADVQHKNDTDAAMAKQREQVCGLQESTQAGRQAGLLAPVHVTVVHNCGLSECISLM